MHFKSINLEIRESKEIGKNCMYLSFKGKFTELSSIKGTAEIIKELESKPDDIEMVWDCCSMTGFELKARKEWYKFLKEYSGRIYMVTVISNSLMIRGAARVMLEIFKIKSRVLKSRRELLVKTEPFR